MTEHRPERNLGQRVGIALALAIAAVAFLAGIVSRPTRPTLELKNAVSYHHTDR